MVIFFMALMSLNSVQASPQQFEIIARNKNGRAIHTQVALPELLNPDFAETADFKVVQGTQTEPVEWKKLSAPDRLRAANLIYHLTRAKHYFIEHFHSENVQKLEPLMIRMNMTRGFNRLGHFDNPNLSPNHNNAFSIPGGTGIALVRQNPEDPASPVIERKSITWKREIFFSPPEKVSMKKLLEKMDGDPLDPAIDEARRVAYPSQINTATQNAARFLFVPEFGRDAYLSSFVTQIGILGAIEGSFLLMKAVNRMVLPRYYFLDTALVPEIIYHEFSHQALSDYLVPNLPTPVVEGLADYFSADLARTPKIAKRIKEFSTGRGKDGSKVKDFSVTYERNDQATADYVLSLLWGLRTVLGDEPANRLIWSTRVLLNSYDSDIRTSLIGGLLATCRTVCEHPLQDVLALNQYFSDHAKGL